MRKYFLGFFSGLVSTFFIVNSGIFLDMEDKSKSELEQDLLLCVRRHLWDYEVEINIIPDKVTQNSKNINFRIFSNGKEFFNWKGNHGLVFTRIGDVLFFADHELIKTGCDVFAYDLQTKKFIWMTELFGLGPVDHSKYSNWVTIENDGYYITIHGIESFGEYWEVLDSTNGKKEKSKIIKK